MLDGKRLARGSFVVVIALAAVSACGQDVAQPKASRPYIRPKAMTLQVPYEQLRASGAVDSLSERDRVQQNELQNQFSPYFTPGGAPLPVFLERDQITYTGGADNSAQNRSSVVGGGSATVGGFRGGDAAWTQVVACVQDQFARFNVEVTDVEPATGEYVEAHFGGTPGQVGLPNGSAAWAPIDNFSCNIIPRAVVYIFSDVLGNSAQLNCEVAAQEIAHAFSLDHEFLCQDPMTYLSGCGNKTFQDVNAQCGEFEPRQCNCGRSSHNSVALMTEKLGATGGNVTDPGDSVPPVASIASPANDAALLANTTMTVVADATDDVQVVSTELIWDFNGQIFGCPTSVSGGAVTCTRNGNRSTWTLAVGQGDRTFSVRVRDAGGNQVVTPSRTIHLTADGTAPPPPPVDNVAPVVTMVTPPDGAELQANSIIEVTATATDNQGLAAVELVWTSSATDTFPCPLSGNAAISCVVTGDTYTWSLNVGVGQRAFQVQATDLAGNQSSTPERTVTLTENPSPPVDPPTGDNDVAEPNNSKDAAFATRCGTALDIVATPGDQDWFTVEAPVGTDVEVGLSAAGGSALSLSLFRADGTTALAETTDALSGSLAVTSADNVVLARVTTTGGSSISYRIAVACGNDDLPLPPGSDDDLEPNNSADDAERSFCGQERHGLAALDDDFFVVGVRQGDTLDVALTGGGVSGAILDASGNELDTGSETLHIENLAAGDYVVKVSPLGAGASYDVTFECTENGSLTPAGADGCGCDASTTNGSSISLMALAAFAFLRRRRGR